MNTCATEKPAARAARAAARAALALTLAASPVAASQAEELELRGSASLGARIYALEKPFDDDLSGFFDQFRFIRTKRDHPAWFVDLLHFDAGLFRQDDTALIRAHRESSGWSSERGALALNWKGLGLEVDYSRHRSDELRVFPRTTEGELTTFPIAFSTRFNPDTDANNPLGRGRRLFVRRTGVGGEIAIRPEDFGGRIPILDEFRFWASHEERHGARQDRFLLDGFPRELGSDGSATARFRANRRALDQQVTRIGGVLVVSPGGLFTGAARVQFENFRERAAVVRLADLAAAAPGIGSTLGPEEKIRAIRFVPSTNHLNASLELSRRIGGASLGAGVSTSRVRQAHQRSPLQELHGLDTLDIETTTVHAAADVPLWGPVSASGFFKLIRRVNDFDPSALDSIATGTSEVTRGQVDPFLRRRTEINSGVELSVTPMLGTRVAIGHRLQRVDRDLRFAQGPGAILPAFDLREEKSEVHSLYLSARSRLRRRIRLSGEIGTQWAPRVGLPRDLETAIFFEGRASGSLARPVPISWSGFGKVRFGKNDEITLTGQDRSVRKEFEQTLWSYGLTLNARPRRSLSLFASFVHQHDRQQFPHIRSNLPRFIGPLGLAFFRDSTLGVVSDLKTVVLGSNIRVFKWLNVSLSSTLGWVSNRFDRDSPAGTAIDRANRIRARTTSFDARLAATLRPGLRVDLGYRLDEYDDQINLDPLDLDERIHAVTLSVRVDLERFGAPISRRAGTPSERARARHDDRGRTSARAAWLPQGQPPDSWNQPVRNRVLSPASVPDRRCREPRQAARARRTGVSGTQRPLEEPPASPSC